MTSNSSYVKDLCGCGRHRNMPHSSAPTQRNNTTWELMKSLLSGLEEEERQQDHPVWQYSAQIK
ncbi:Hypothetical predicted protein, partial [Pelobates cultripes]